MLRTRLENILPIIYRANNYLDKFSNWIFN
jgi:hypothetical protein